VDDSLASSSEDGTIIIWDLETGNIVKTLKGHKKWAWPLVELPKLELISGGDTAVKFWNIDTGSCVKTIQNKERESCNSIVLLNSEDMACVRKNDITVYSIDCKADNSGVVVDQPKKVLKGHGHCVISLLLMDDNTTLISSGTDKEIKAWNLKTWECFRTFKGHTESLWYSYQYQKNILVSAGWDGTLKFWSLAENECLMSIFVPKGEKVFLNGNVIKQKGDEKVGKEKEKVVKEDEMVRKPQICFVTVSPKGELVTCGEETMLRFWSSGVKK